MTDGDLLREITAAYQKFGWTLRRVMLTTDARRELQAQNLIAETVRIENSDVNALWFSRLAAGDRETWELRLLSSSPFALLETFEKSMPDSEREMVRAAMLEKLQINALKIKV